LPPERGNEYGARASEPQPGQESIPLFRTSKVVQAQFQRARFQQTLADLRLHLARSFGGDDATHPVFPKDALQAPSITEAKL
jgi:hypothetical protein